MPLIHAEAKVLIYSNFANNGRIFTELSNIELY